MILEGENLDAPAGKLCDLSKSRGIVDGEVSEHLTIQLDTGLSEAIHKPAVRKAMHSGAGVNPGDPERAEMTLSHTAVSVSILESFLDAKTGRYHRLAAGPAISFCLFQ